MSISLSAAQMHLHCYVSDVALLVSTAQRRQHLQTTSDQS
jgi:hypothetical protein